MKWGICKYCHKLFSCDTPTNYRKHLKSKHKDALATMVNEERKEIMRNILQLDENLKPIDDIKEEKDDEKTQKKAQKCATVTINKFKSMITELLLSLGCSENAVNNEELQQIISVKIKYIFSCSNSYFLLIIGIFLY